MVVQLDIEDYRRGVQDLQYSVVARFSCQRGEEPPTNMNLKKTLEALWDFNSFKVIHLKGAIYHILLNAFDHQSSVMAMGAVNVKPGILRFSRWKPGIDVSNYMITTSQIWIRIHDLLLEYRKEQNVLNIASGVGLPLKIDPLSLSLYHGRYARVLVHVDFSQPPPERILAKLVDEESNIDISFFVPISYER